MHVALAFFMGTAFGGVVAHYATRWGLMNEIEQIVTQFHSRLDAIEAALNIRKAHVVTAAGEVKKAF